MNKKLVKMTNNRVILLWAIIVLGVLLPNTASSQGIYKDASMNEKHKMARKNVQDAGFEHAINKYSDLLKQEDNETVRAEYAYALALAQCYDGAIMNLDKVYVSGKADKTTLFYTAQVLKLMEYEKLSEVFWTIEVSSPPSWISAKYVAFVDKYKHRASINTDNLGIALHRANMLVAQKQYIQAIVLYQELTETYPYEYLPYIGFSALWESLGYKDLAIEYLQQGLVVMDNEKTKCDPDGVYERHLTSLKSENMTSNRAFDHNVLKNLGESTQSSSNDKEKQFYRRKYMYIGMTAINKSLSFEARYGIYTSDRSSFAVGLGYQSFGDAKSLTATASLYAGILGLGLQGQVYDGSFDGGFGISVGGSLPKKPVRHSLDYRVGLYYYMIKAKDLRVNVSIGYTYYF